MSMIILFECLSHNSYTIFVDLEFSSDFYLLCSRFNTLFKFSFITYSLDSAYHLSSMLSQWLVHCLWILGASLSAILFTLRLK